MAAPSGTGRLPVMKSFWMSTKRRAVFIFMRVCEVGVNEKSGAKVAAQAVFPSSGARDVTSRGWGTRFSAQKGCSPKLSAPFFILEEPTLPRSYTFLRGEALSRTSIGSLFREKLQKWGSYSYISREMELKWDSDSCIFREMRWNEVWTVIYSEKWFWNELRIAIYFEIWYKIIHRYVYISGNDTKMRFG